MNPSIRLLTPLRTLTVPLRTVHTPFLVTRRIPIRPILPRSYATAPKGIKPPITIHTLEGTYASALFSASSQNTAVINEIEKSLSKIRQKLDSDAKLQSVVVNPALSHKEKLEIVQLLTQTGGGSAEASRAVKNLLEVMSENGRLGHWAGVVSAFEKIMRAHKGEVDVIVTSAQVSYPLRLYVVDVAIGRSCVESFGTIDFKVFLAFKGPESQNGK